MTDIVKQYIGKFMNESKIQNSTWDQIQSNKNLSLAERKIIELLPLLNNKQDILALRKSFPNIVDAFMEYEGINEEQEKFEDYTSFDLDKLDQFKKTSDPAYFLNQGLDELDLVETKSLEEYLNNMDYEIDYYISKRELDQLIALSKNPEKNSERLQQLLQKAFQSDSDFGLFYGFVEPLNSSELTIQSNPSKLEPLIKTALQDQGLWSNNMKVVDDSNTLHKLIVTFHPEEKDQYNDNIKLDKIERTIHNLKAVRGTNSFVENQGSAVVWTVEFNT